MAVEVLNTKSILLLVCYRLDLKVLRHICWARVLVKDIFGLDKTSPATHPQEFPCMP